MRKLYQLTRLINGLLYRQRFEKIYYVKAPPLALAEEKITRDFNLQSRTNRFALGLIGFLILAPIISQLLHGHLLLKGESHAEAYDLKLYPAPTNSNYLYQNTVNGFKIYLGNRLQENKPNVRFEEGNSSVEFVPDFGQPLNKNTQLLANDESLMYKNVLPGIDLKYSLNGKGIKEEIIINNKEQTTNNIEQFKFSLNLKNAVPKKSLEGETQAYFIEPTDEEYRFHIPKPFMIDAAGNRSEAVELKIIPLSSLNNNGGQNTYIITLIPNQEWLQSAVYPVTIDPSIVHDESSEFTGTTNRIEDEGSSTTPKLRASYHELPADEHTVGLWHMNNDWNDSSGNGNNGTANGGVGFTTSAKLGSHAGDFDGGDDYISVADNNNLDLKTFTVEVWVYPERLNWATGYQGIISKGSGDAANRNYALLVKVSDCNAHYTFSDGSNWASHNSTNCLVENRWQHLAYTFDGSVSSLYIDGKLDSSYGETITPAVNSETLTIGEITDYEEFDGKIDEVRISDVARTAEEIKQDAQRFPYGVYSSDTIDLTSGNGTIASAELEWTDNVSTPGATLDGWTNLKPVIIDNTQNSNTLTDYQTKVHVDYDSSMQADFDDLRFTSYTATVSAYGSESDFNQADTHEISTAKLDLTHFVVAYRDDGGDDYGCAKIGTVTGTSISYGSEYCFNETSSENHHVIALDSTHFVVAYRDYSGDTYGCTKLGTVSGTDISYGSESCFYEANSNQFDLAKLNPIHFVVGYEVYSGSDYGCAKLGTVSGTNISYGSEACFNEASTGYPTVISLDPTHFLAGYVDDGGDDYGCSKVGTVSGTNISYGSEACFNDGSGASTGSQLSFTTLDTTHFVAGYRKYIDVEPTYYACAKIGTVSGTTTTYGSEYCFNETNTGEISLSSLTSTRFVAAYKPITGYLPPDSQGHIKIGTIISGNKINYGVNSVFSWDRITTELPATPLDSTHFVVGYDNAEGDTYGHAKVGTVVNTNLDYWIEAKSDGVEAEVWVEVDTIPASSLTTIWMWYGNGGASAGSSGTNTFVFFDDFNDGSLNGTLWNSAGTVSESGGVVTITNSGSYIGSKTSYGVNYSLAYRGNHPNVETNWVGFISGSSTPFAIFERYATSQWNARSYVSAETITALSTSLLGTYQRYEIERNNGSSNIYYVNDGSSGSGTHTTQVTSNSLPLTAYMLGTGSLSLDWIALRSFTPIEPIVGVGADIEFQTRTSADGSSWEAWKPTSNETQILSMDSDATNWTTSTETSSGALSYGDEAIFNSANSNSIAVAPLDSTHFVVAYKDEGGADYGCAKVGSISGSDITYGSENCFNDAATDNIAVTALDSTHFVVGYGDDGGDDYGCTRVGLVSGTTISSYGTENCFNSADITGIALTTLDSTHFVVAYRDNGGDTYGHARVGVVSGTTITSYGSEATFNSASIAGTSLTALDSTHFVVAYRDNGGDTYGHARVGVVSGTTITSYGSEATFNSSTIWQTALTTLDSTHFVVAYDDTIGDTYGHARVGVVSGTTITSYGSEATFSKAETGYISVATLGPSRVVFGYWNQDINHSKATVGIVSGTTITYGSEATFNAASSAYISLGILDTTNFVVAYQDYGGDTNGHAKVGKYIPQNLSKDNESTIKMEGDGSLIATVGAPQPDFNTAALWHLEETGGTGAYILDETANNNDGTPTGTSTTDGFYGKARNFDGSDDYIEIGDKVIDGLTSFTVEAWIKPSSITSSAPSHGASSGGNAIVDKSGAGDDNFAFLIGSSDELYLYIDTGTDYDVVTTTSPIAANTWSHVVGVYNGNNLKLFVNGNQIVADSANGTIIDNANNLNIGNEDEGGQPFNGVIDEVSISNTARTSEEIAEAYRAGRDHRLSRTISSTDLSGKTKMPFYFAADKQGTIAETYVGETDHAVYSVDSSTVALWHLDDNPQDYEGYNSPSTAADDSGTGTLTWSNPSYVKVSDDNRATAQPGSAGTYYTHYLKATNFGFNIPSNAKILGIRVGIEKQETCSGSGCYVRDNRVRIVKGGSIGSTDKANTVTDWSLSEAYTNYGGSSDLWGETWTAADINASNFGVVLSAKIYDSLCLFACEAAHVDHMRIDVWYAPIKDESANGNMAKSRGGAAYTSSGKIGGARYFDGTNDYLEMGDILDFENTDNFSIEAWVKTTAGTNQIIVAKFDQTSPYPGYEFYQTTSGYLSFILANSLTAPNFLYITASEDPITDGKWHHVAATYDGSKSASGAKLYRDGKQLSTTTNSDTLTNSILTDIDFEIGARDGANLPFSGLIDEVRVSDSVRTPDEIRLAYQYCLRTHQINIDFKASLDSGNLIADSDDTSFTVDATAYGLEDKGNALYVGDKVIVKENVNGTNYIAQGDVASVSVSSGATTVSSWDNGSTFPSGGYTINATVFKWQREYWDLNDISPNDRDATVRLGMRILDANEGFTMYLDDFESNTNYLTDNLGSTVTSTANRYIQYRAILSTNNTEVTPELTSVTLDYNRYPTAPTSLLTNDLINPGNVTDTTPYFSAIYNDPDEYDVANKYWLQVDDNADFGSTIWDSGSSGTAMTNCAEGNRCEDITYGGASTDLQWGTRYYWRIKFWDEDGAEGDWSASGDYFVMKTMERPKVCVIDDGSQPGELTVSWLDETDLENGYRIEKKTDSGDFTLLATDPANTTSRLDDTTSAEYTYQYRIRANSDNGNSEWCTTAPVDFSTGSFMFEGVQIEGVKID